MNQIKNQRFFTALFATVFLLLCSSGRADECANNYAGLGDKKIPQVETFTGAFVRSAQNPKEVDLAATFGDLEGRVFIGIESWGHAFLQVGKDRFDGHVLKPTQVKRGSVTMRDGHVFELKGINPASFRKIQELMQARDGKPSLSCVREILEILNKTTGFALAGNNRHTIWLTDLAESLLSGQVKKGQVPSITVASSTDMPAEELLRRVKKSEERWRNETITRTLGVAVEEIDLRNPFPLDAIKDLAAQSNVSVPEVQYLADQILQKARIGAHAEKVILPSEVARLPKDIQTLLDEDSLITFEWSGKNSPLYEVPFPSNLSDEALKRYQDFELELAKPLLDFNKLILRFSALNHAELKKRALSELLKKYSIRRLSKIQMHDLATGKTNSIALKEIEKIKISHSYLSQFLAKQPIPGITAQDLLPLVNSLPLEENNILRLLEAYQKEMPAGAAAGKHLEEIQARLLRAARPDAVDLSKADPWQGIEIHSVASIEAESPHVKNLTERLRNGAEHTLDVDRYIERHLSASLIDLIEKNKMPVNIIASSRLDALAHLKAKGFTQVVELPKNSATDFQKWIVINPETKKMEFVLQTLNGRSTIDEAVSHFTAHSRFLKNPLGDRLRVLRSTQSVKDEFKETLAKHGISNVDLVSFGSVKAMNGILRKKGATQIANVVDDNFMGSFFELNGKRILLLPIEPNFFGDRSGELLKAVLESQAKKPKVFFSGTAGSLVGELKIHDIVLPSNFSQGNGIAGSGGIVVDNKVKDVVAQDFASVGSIKNKQDYNHVAVDSILFEDKAWMNSMTQGPESKKVVEQELYDVAKVVNENELDFYGVLRISDELSTGVDFSAVELNGALGGSPEINPSQILQKSLERAFP